jgi:hypothetical protein
MEDQLDPDFIVQGTVVVEVEERLRPRSRIRCAGSDLPETDRTKDRVVAQLRLASPEKRHQALRALNETEN